MGYHSGTLGAASVMQLSAKWRLLNPGLLPGKIKSLVEPLGAIQRMPVGRKGEFESVCTLTSKHNTHSNWDTDMYNNARIWGAA